MIQAQGQILHPGIPMLLICINLIWSKDEFPEQWKESITVLEEFYLLGYNMVCSMKVNRCHLHLLGRISSQARN
jgi:hypothetical protein